MHMLVWKVLCISNISKEPKYDKCESLEMQKLKYRVTV